jgi:hypothetical protein
MEEISVQPRYLAFFVLQQLLFVTTSLSYWRSRLSDYKMNWFIIKQLTLRLELLWEANIKEKRINIRLKNRPKDLSIINQIQESHILSNN